MRGQTESGGGGREKAQYLRVDVASGGDHALQDVIGRDLASGGKGGPAAAVFQLEEAAPAVEGSVS